MDILKYIKNTFVVSIVVLMIFFVFGQVMLPKEKEILKFQCDEFQGDWEYISDTGERISVEIPGKVEDEAGEEVRIVTTLPDEIDENRVLAFRTVWQDARIYVGNELRTEYSTRESRPFGRNSAFRYVFVELEEGDADYPQLGGYHKDVKTQDPVGFESHHIPSRSVQDVNAEWLPAISISDADHKLTSSYAGKQRKVYEPILPSSIPSVSYKESITQNLEKGGSGYIDSVKAELLDLRMTTDHRYDGGVSGYLDAVIDMLATRGIPEAKR